MNKFSINITGGDGVNSYAAVAFGQTDGMADADLYYCTGTKLQSAVITTATRPTDTVNGVSKLFILFVSSLLFTRISLSQALWVSKWGHCDGKLISFMVKPVPYERN